MTTHLPPGLSPDAVDALTELNAIITRLRNTQAATTTPTNPSQPGTGTTPLPGGVTGTTPLPNMPTPGGGGATTTAATGGSNNNTTTTTPLLSVKELPAATDHLKHKLQRARAAVRGLADVRRSIAQQEAELGRLEERRRLQAGRLARTQEDGMLFVKAEGERGMVVE